MLGGHPADRCISIILFSDLPLMLPRRSHWKQSHFPHESLRGVEDYFRDRNALLRLSRRGIIVADNILTRGALNGALNMIRTRVVCMRGD